MTEHPMPERQQRAVDLQKKRSSPCRMARPFIRASNPHTLAVELLAKIASSDSSFAEEARAVLADWRAGLATPMQIARVETDGDLEIDRGAVVSIAEDGTGLWISTWTWLYTGDPPAAA